jgi:hypothetical protein
MNQVVKPTRKGGRLKQNVVGWLQLSSAPVVKIFSYFYFRKFPYAIYIYFCVRQISDDKLWLTQQASSLAAAREINAGSTKNSSSSFDEAETDAVTPEPTRKSHRAVAQTEKAKQLQEDKKEKAAVDLAEKERLALKAEKKKKKKADRSQLANEILKQVVTSPSSSSSVAVASSPSVAVGDQNSSNSSQNYEDIMLKIKEQILKIIISSHLYQVRGCVEAGGT